MDKIQRKKCPGTKTREPHVEDLTEKNFARNKSRADGYSPYCKKCASDRLKEWRRKNRDKVRAAQRRYLEKAGTNE